MPKKDARLFHQKYLVHSMSFLLGKWPVVSDYRKELVWRKYCRCQVLNSQILLFACKVNEKKRENSSVFTKKISKFAAVIKNKIRIEPSKAPKKQSALYRTSFVYYVSVASQRVSNGFEFVVPAKDRYFEGRSSCRYIACFPINLFAR